MIHQYQWEKVDGKLIKNIPIRLRNRDILLLLLLLLLCVFRQGPIIIVFVVIRSSY